MSDDFKRLWESTLDLHERFFPDNSPSFEARYRVFCEEVAELTLALTDAQYDTIGDVPREAADVLVTLFGLLQGYGVPYDHLLDAIEFTAEKNDSKTLDTHSVRQNGKISRFKD